jgi:hypothetical protein
VNGTLVLSLSLMHSDLILYEFLMLGLPLPLLFCRHLMRTFVLKCKGWILWRLHPLKLVGLASFSMHFAEYLAPRVSANGQYICCNLHK